MLMPSYVGEPASSSMHPCTCMPALSLADLAMQVFAGALGALAAMTVLSAVMGWAAPSLVGTAQPSHTC